MRKLRLPFILSIAAGILLIPLIAMQFTSEVDWDGRDFLIMGMLLFGTGCLIEFALRKLKSTKSRIIACGIILAALFLVWAELAVGIFGSPFAGS